MKFSQIFSDMQEQLEAVGEERESLSFVYRSLHGLSLTDFVFKMQEEVSDKEQAEIELIFKKLLAHQPAQYIIGTADFYSHTFQVDERVLIPRQETEELVSLILAENNDSTCSVLDIGTGSGAIAISLAYARTSWDLTASDISKEALEVAMENARLLQTDVTFIHSDCFDNILGKYDIIVSNPPYISEQDKKEVAINVLSSEPHLALFAADDGTAIYQKIATKAGNYLSKKGKIYLEIGYKQGRIVQKIFSTVFPEKRIRVLQDQFGKDRMVVVDNG
ncbi:MAG: peptide chain release factor N(5)-glutamine methyltransferase [Streptococcus sp.]|nr:peptide chain release factor N(5)-glutamine methyltransferase [Streptococcus sp.]